MEERRIIFHLIDSFSLLYFFFCVLLTLPPRTSVVPEPILKSILQFSAILSAILRYLKLVLMPAVFNNHIYVIVILVYVYLGVLCAH